MADWFDQNAPKSETGGDWFAQNAPKAQEEKPSLAGFGRNVLSSAGNFASGVGHAIAHPIDTASALVKTAAGGVNEAAKGIGLPGVPGVSEGSFDALKKTYGDRYGSVDQALHTAYSDPVGFAADLATVAGGGGALAKAAKLAADAAGLSGAANVAGKAGEIANIAGKVDPVNVASKAAGLLKRPVDAARNAVADRVYGAALKPVPSTPLVQRAEMVNAGLSNKIPLTEKGSAKIKARIEDTDNQVLQRVKQGGLQGDTISSQSVADATNRSRDQFAGQINPVSDLRDVAAAKQEFLEQHGGIKPAVQPQPTGLIGPNGQPIMGAGTPAVPPQPIPVDTALNIARKTKPKAYGELSGATNESLKDMKRDIKQQIYNMYPELKDSGNKQRIDIDLDEAIDHRLGVEANKTVMSMAGPIAGVLADHAVPGSGLLVGIAKHVIDKTPGLASKIAIAVSTKSPKGIVARGAGAAGSAVGKVATPTERLAAPASNVMEMPMPLPAAAQGQQQQPNLGAGMMPPPQFDPLDIYRR